MEALRAAPTVVEVAGLLADSTNRVWVEAQRLGSVQTPRWVGDFESGFTLLPTIALPLLAVPTLTRGEILLLINQGLTQPDSGWAVVEPLATQLFGVARAQQLAVVRPLPPAIK